MKYANAGIHKRRINKTHKHDSNLGELMCQCTIINFWQMIVLFMCLCIYLIMQEMYSSYSSFIDEFLFMCLFVYSIVYWGYFKFVYDFMFLMYLVMDHMHWFFYVFERSSSIWSVTGVINNLFCFVLFCFFIFIFIFFTYVNGFECVQIWNRRGMRMIVYTHICRNY